MSEKSAKIRKLYSHISVLLDIIDYNGQLSDKNLKFHLHPLKFNRYEAARKAWDEHVAEDKSDE